jgi:hypothetical protein
MKKRFSLEMVVPVRKQLEDLKIKTNASTLSQVVQRAILIYEEVVKANGELIIVDGEEKRQIKILI